MSSSANKAKLDFANTEIAFAHMSNKKLKKSKRLFSVMGKAWLVNLMSPLGLFAIKYKLPFAKTIIKKTIFSQFIGGTTLEKAQPSINTLFENKCRTFLDYGIEGKESVEDFQRTKEENLKAVAFAASNQSIPIVTVKVTGLATTDLVENFGTTKPSSEKHRLEFEEALARLDAICGLAHQQGVSIYIDAEESWIQECIDHMVELMMIKYNEERAVVYNTFQMYRKDRLQFLKDSHQKALVDGYFLGAKLVRGAYMVKERARAEANNYPSPIHDTKADSDKSYNDGLRYVIEHIDTIACCTASHNAVSNKLFADMVAERGIAKNHPHVNFCQLYGMSDNITFNLAAAGYNAAKYVPYGPVEEVIPYLIRRAQENTSVTGDMSRELRMISDELKRRRSSPLQTL